MSLRHTRRLRALNRIDRWCRETCRRMHLIHPWTNQVLRSIELRPGAKDDIWARVR